VNLLENVIRHTPDGTPAEISARTNAGRDRVEVDVADRGPGIPEDHEERIFTRFERATDRADGGVGLGLAICRAALVAHGGTLIASRREGGGAVFRMTLPVPEGKDASE